MLCQATILRFRQYLHDHSTTNAQGSTFIYSIIRNSILISHSKASSAVFPSALSTIYRPTLSNPILPRPVSLNNLPIFHTSLNTLPYHLLPILPSLLSGNPMLSSSPPRSPDWSLPLPLNLHKHSTPRSIINHNTSTHGAGPHRCGEYMNEKLGRYGSFCGRPTSMLNKHVLRHLSTQYATPTGFT